MRILFLILCAVSLLYSAEPHIAVPPPTPPPAPTVPEKSYWQHHQSASIGYRRDRQSFQNDTTKQTVTNRNSLELILKSHVEWHHFVFYLQGAYGWLANGDFDYSVFGTLDQEPLPFPTNFLGAGYTADAASALGVEFKIIDRPNFFVSLIPFGGFKYSHLMNFPKGRETVEFLNGFAIATFPAPNQQDWYGPFFEGRIRLISWKSVEWLLFYQYHRPCLRSKSVEQVDLYLLSIPSVDLYHSTSIYKVNLASKQLAGIDIKYHNSEGWNFGLHFEGSSAWSKEARYRSKRVQEQYLQSPTGETKSTVKSSASIHWVCYEASISLGYPF